MKKIEIVTATIANGASLSDEINLGDTGRLEIIHMPSAWTAADLTFQIATTTGGTFKNQYDSAGNEATVVAAASRAIDVTAEVSQGMRFIKLRSGTAGTPVNQADVRSIQLTIVHEI